jgi:hypothetical protein
MSQVSPPSWNVLVTDPEPGRNSAVVTTSCDASTRPPAYTAPSRSLKRLFWLLAAGFGGRMIDSA